jgi:hypothetical protein
MDRESDDVRDSHMNSSSSSEALSFLDQAELPPPPPPPPSPQIETTEAVAEFNFDSARDQAVVVGSDIISFVRGVSEQRRQDIVNSALLAQLVASKRVPDPTHVFTWYGVYFDTLTNIGWTIQDRQFVDHIEESKNLEAHKAIIELATSLVGPQAAALQLVKTTLTALQSMDQSSPWITLFNRESRFAKSARFQITLAEEKSEGQFLVTLMAFGLVAAKTLTQVLFFKFRSNEVRLKHSSGKVTINTTVLDAIREPISKKLAAFSTDYVRGLPEL